VEGAARPLCEDAGSPNLRVKAYYVHFGFGFYKPSKSPRVIEEAPWEASDALVGGGYGGVDYEDLRVEARSGEWGGAMSGAKRSEAKAKQKQKRSKSEAKARSKSEAKAKQKRSKSEAKAKAKRSTKQWKCASHLPGGMSWDRGEGLEDDLQTFL
jgi:hypothetical protein